MREKKENNTLCWNCANFAKCSWSRGEPVEGWDATPTKIEYEDGGKIHIVDSFIVNNCPQFEQDKIIRITVNQLAKIVGISERHFYRWVADPINSKYLKSILKKYGYKFKQYDDNQYYYVEKIDN